MCPHQWVARSPVAIILLEDICRNGKNHNQVRANLINSQPDCNQLPTLDAPAFHSGQAGWYLIAATSEGSPQWAGIIADGNEFVGHPLGFINPALYAIGDSSARSHSYHDVTIGNNSAGGIPGYHAAPGWDPVTGWGSPNAANLLEEIIQAKS